MARGSKKKARPVQGLGSREEHFLHVKEFSQGKPNELSLNVLEQKAAAAEEQPSRWQRLRERVGAGVSRETSPGAASAPDAEGVVAEVTAAPSGDGAPKRTRHRGRRAYESAHAAPKQKKGQTEKPSSFLGSDSQVEIEHRQRRRRRYRRISLAVVGVACMCLLAVGGSWAYQEHERLSTSVGVLREACSLIAESDEVTVALDDYFQSEFDDDTAKTAQGLIDQLPAACEKLEQARLYAHKAQGELKGSQRDAQAAEDVLNSLASREAMFDAAEERLTEDIQAAQALDAMEAAQRSIQEGNALMQQAARVVSDTTNENVESSTRYTTEAQLLFASARASLDQAHESYPSVDLSAYYSYVDKRSEAAAEALASNAAILLQDRATAESHNDAYNAADAAAAALAQDMPKEFTQPVIDAYASQTEDAYESYEAARHDAAVSDSHLREYLA